MMLSEDNQIFLGTKTYLIFVYRVLTNPWIFALLQKLFNSNEINHDEYLILLKKIIEYFVMKFPSKKIVFKLPVFCTPIVEVIDQALESTG